MPHTLVTGGNSFVAAHVIKELIAAGHTVTGSVRRTSAGEAVLEEHPEWKGKLDFVLIEDYAEAGAFDPVFKSQQFDHVRLSNKTPTPSPRPVLTTSQIVHVAAPLLDNPENTDFDRDFLRPSVEGNLSLLRSAKAYAPTLKSIAITGSINALTMGSPEEIKANVFSNDFWNPITAQTAREAQNAYLSYCSSKKEAELAVWSFLEKEKPAFSVTVFLPALIFGPPIQPVKGLKSLNYSSNVFYSLWNGSYEEIPPTSFPSYIDVRDLAIVHVKALTEPKAANKRFLIGGAPLTYTLIVKTLAKLVESGELKELEGRLPKESGEDANVVFPRIEAKEGNEVFGITFRTAEETFGDAAKSILELEKRFGKA